MKMKHLARTMVVTVACAVVFCAPAAAKEFVLGTLADPEAPLIKTRIAFLQECFKEHGYDLTVKHLPALRSLEAADKGETDGDMFREVNMDTTGYPNMVMVNYPLSYYPLFAFVSNPDIKAKGIQGVKGLTSYRVITMRGDRIMERFINPVMPKDKLTVIASYDQAFKMVAAGRADVVVSDRSRALHFINELGLKDKVMMVTPPLMIPNLYTYFNKKHAALAEDIAKTMKAKMDDGTYQKIVGVPPPDPKNDSVDTGDDTWKKARIDK